MITQHLCTHSAWQVLLGQIAKLDEEPHANGRLNMNTNPTNEGRRVCRRTTPSPLIGAVRVGARRWGPPIAAHLGHAEVVAELLAAGADVNLKNSSGNTPVHRAAEGGHLQVQSKDDATNRNQQGS